MASQNALNNMSLAAFGIGASATTAALYVNLPNRIGAWVTGANISTGSDADGIFVDASFQPSSNVTNCASIGLYPTMAPPGGVTITNGYGLYVASGTFAGAGTVTTGYGIYVTAPTIASTNITAQLDNIRLDSNTIQATNANGNLTVQSAGIGTLSLGANATNHQTTLGSLTGTSATTIQSGSGKITLDANTANTTVSTGDFDVTRSANGTTVTSTISNTSNTASSNSLSQITVAGSTANDPFQTFTVTGVTNWSQGIDNSVSGDPFVIAASTALGTSNVLSSTTTGTITLPSGDFIITRSGVGGPVSANVINTDNTNTASASLLHIISGGTSGGDALILYDVTGSSVWASGLDNFDSDKYKVSASNDLGTSDTLIITRSGEVTEPLQPAFSYYNSTARTNVTGDGTDYTLIFNTANFTQQGSGFDGTSTFTAPVTGVYLFTLGVRSTGYVLQNIAFLSIVISGVTYYGPTINPTNVVIAGGGLGMTFSVMHKMTAGTTAIAHLASLGSTKTVSIDNTQADTFFTGVLLC